MACSLDSEISQGAPAIPPSLHRPPRTFSGCRPPKSLTLYPIWPNGMADPYLACLTFSIHATWVRNMAKKVPPASIPAAPEHTAQYGTASRVALEQPHPRSTPHPCFWNLPIEERIFLPCPPGCESINLSIPVICPGREFPHFLVLPLLFGPLVLKGGYLEAFWKSVKYF